MAEVSDVPEERRYVLTLEGQQVGRLDYDIDGDVFVALHVGVDPPHEGHGLGSALVRQVLDEVRRSGRRLRPLCPFAVYFVRENPQYADLLEGARTAADEVS
jgi:predicted GNAT family acetyltransferase